MTEEVTAHQQMMDAHIRGDSAGAQALSEKVNIETGISASGTEGDASQVAAHQLASMPDAPKVEVGVADRAVAKLNELGGEHAALVHEWQQTGANIVEELAYAKAAFEKYATPELIKKFDESGLGNDPAVLKLLAKHGRLDAGLMGDLTVSSRNYDAPSEQTRIPAKTSSAQAELNKIFEDTPPGTQGYAKRSVQDRVRQLSEMIHGDGPAVGLGGRTA